MMEVKKSLNPSFWKTSRGFFESYQEQLELIELLFAETANEFPQKLLKSYFPNAKGSKLSKGINLGHFPYQVLDIVRDFDPESGFNIRYLNWWGHGFFVIITYGHKFKNRYMKKWITFPGEYFISIDSPLYDYDNLLKNKLILSEKNITLAKDSSNQLQIWKELCIEEDVNKTHLKLVKLTLSFLNLHRN